MTTTTEKRMESPKAYLDNKDNIITIGDFVTTDDDSSIIKAFVLKEQNGTTSTVYGLALSDCEDDLVINEYIVSTASLIYLDESFVNVNGILWNVRKLVKSGKSDSIKTSAFIKSL